MPMGIWGRDTYDPTSTQSQAANQLTTQALKASNPNSTFTLPEGMSAADLSGENSVTGNITKGGYSVQAGQLKASTIGNAIADKNNIARDNQASAAVDKVVNDPQLKAHTQRVQGANRIQGQLDDIKQGKIVDTNQFLNDLNTEYVNLLTGANNSALGKLERTEYRSTAGDIAGVIQKLSGNPQSIRSPEILKQLETSVAGLKQTYQKNIDTRALQLQRSYAHNPDATQAQKQAIQDMINTNGTGSAPAPASGLLNQSAPPAPKIGDVIQGHKYLGGPPADPNSWGKQ